MHRNLLVFLVASAVLLSGFTLAANTGKGFVVLSIPLTTLAVLLHMGSHRYYRAWWLFAFCGFLAIACVNGSRPGSIALIANAMLLAELLRVLKRETDVTFTDEMLLAALLFLLLCFSLVDLLALSNSLNTWSDKGKYLHIPRLNFWFSEPSHLGPFVVALFFAMRWLPLRGLLLATLFLTQSYYAISYFFLHVLRRHLLFIVGVCFAILLVIYWQTKEQVDVFFSNSGLVRLVGLSLFKGFGLKELLIGAGVGSGDEALKQIFLAQGVKTPPNGFLFSLVYDLGIFGLFFLYLAFVRSPFDAIRLTFLFLNFGAGSFLVPVLMSIDPLARKTHYEDRLRLQLAARECESA